MEGGEEEVILGKEGSSGEEEEVKGGEAVIGWKMGGKE